METLIFYTYEFAASILPFSAAFIFLSHKQKKGGEKTHLLPGLLLFLFAVYIVCVYHVTGTGTLWDAFLYRFQTEISHINPIPFCGNRYGRIYFEYHPVHSVWVFDPFNLEKNEIAAPNRPCRIFFFHTDRNKPVIK